MSTHGSPGFSFTAAYLRLLQIRDPLAAPAQHNITPSLALLSPKVGICFTGCLPVVATRRSVRLCDPKAMNVSVDAVAFEGSSACVGVLGMRAVDTALVSTCTCRFRCGILFRSAFGRVTECSIHLCRSLLESAPMLRTKSDLGPC